MDAFSAGLRLVISLYDADGHGLELAYVPPTKVDERLLAAVVSIAGSMHLTHDYLSSYLHDEYVRVDKEVLLFILATSDEDPDPDGEAWLMRALDMSAEQVRRYHGIWKDHVRVHPAHAEDAYLVSLHRRGDDGDAARVRRLHLAAVREFNAHPHAPAYAFTLQWGGLGDPIPESALRDPGNRTERDALAWR
jgi:hypothetical protein